MNKIFDNFLQVLMIEWIRVNKLLDFRPRLMPVKLIAKLATNFQCLNPSFSRDC